MDLFTILLVQPLINGLIIFYKVLGQNMGIAILVFSVFLKVILSPITKSSLENAKKAREWQPQIDKLKKRINN